MKVLIADDEPITRRLLEGLLTQWGHEVASAADGEAAWQRFLEGSYPIVITDWIMPRLDGLELIRRLRAHPRPEYVYAILLTARSEKQDLVVGMEAGADDFLSKPFDREELRVRLRQGERVIALERSLAEQNRALRETQAALVQQEKLASLGQLAAGMAHEINNPMAYVANNLAVLRRDALALLELLSRYQTLQATAEGTDLDLIQTIRQLEHDLDLPYLRGALAPLFDRTAEGLRRIRDIIRNLRDFARLDEAELKDADLNASLSSTLEVLRPEADARGVTLRPRLSELSPVLCHPAKVNQVFFNILLNAIQASSPGGEIEVRSRMCPGVGVVIEIEDHGSGIRPEHLPHLFEPFFTTKPVGQGTGLGLSVGYGIVRDHGGTIEVESTPGQGSTFRIQLPLCPQPR